MIEQGLYTTPFNEKNVIAAMTHSTEGMVLLCTLLAVGRYKEAGEKIADISHAYWMKVSTQ